MGFPVYPSECPAPCNQKSASDTLPEIIEKVYLHIDRSAYFAGDDLWFKAYLVDASDLLLTGHSSNLHVELISPSGTITESQILKLNGGLSKGDFHLPADLKTGVYRIRAYTNFMRNFVDELFFSKDIMVINPSEAKADLPGLQEEITDDPEVRFFPEGGSLVDYVTCTVAFKVTDKSGRGCRMTGKIISSNGDTITDIRTINSGMGKFLLSPVPGMKYYAITSGKAGQLLRFEIPSSFPSGVAMNIVKTSRQQISLILRTNSETFQDFADKELTLLISARNNVYDIYAIRLRSLANTFNIPAAGLPEGIVRLTLLREDGVPLCERLVFTGSMDDVGIAVEPAKGEFGRRDSVTL